MKVGLVGYSCNSGIGELNRQIATYAQVDRWLVKLHSRYPQCKTPRHIATSYCRGNPLEIEQFVKSVDIVLFVETPFFKHLLPLCKQHGKRVVCVPMLEWTPPMSSGSWLTGVDLFICPTRQCADELSSVVPGVYFPWPIDTRRFQFRQRFSCEVFLFLNGHGGWKGRKGAATVRKVKEIWPDMRLLVGSQVSQQWPERTEVLPAADSNAKLYDKGDVLLAPHSIDGLGLELMEAMACGMPVITTEGEPWNEFPALARIRASKKERRVNRSVNWYMPDVQHLVELCKENVGRAITHYSCELRDWAEGRSWELLADRFNALVQNGA